MQDIDQRDRELLNALQGEIPLASTPFAIVGQMIDMSEKEVIKRTERLKREGMIKHVAAQFDMHALSYRSSLVAARVAADRIDDAAAVVNAHPGVTQNYRRNHDFNLWFTIAVPPTSHFGLQRTIEILGDEADCEVVRPLPTVKAYKTNAGDTSESETAASATPLTPAEIECVRLLQRDLPLQPRPFDALARTSAMSADVIISLGRSLLQRGVMRRFGAVIQMRKPGFSASAMCVWVVPADKADEYGMKMAQSRAVSHCYLRPVYVDWPYNLYTIVHGRSIEECESIINDLAVDTGLEEKCALYPTKEYKKARLSFFAPEAEEWEASRGAGAQAATAAS